MEESGSLVSTNRSRRVIHSVVAIIVGALAIIILSTGTDVLMHALHIYPPWFQYMPDSLFLLATAYRVVYSVSASYITARLAPDRPMMHSLILGAIGFVLSTLGAVATWNQGPEFGPKWYPLTLIATSLPLAWLGGKLRVLQLKGRQ